MKKLIIVCLWLVSVTGFLFFSCQPKETVPEKDIAHRLVKQVDSFVASCQKLATAAAKPGADEKELQHLFLEARMTYKSFEWAAEYFEPATSRFVNGAPVQEVEPSGQVFEPAGLQVIEGYLFPHYDATKKVELQKQLSDLPLRCKKYTSHFQNVALLNWQVFDAAKLEVFRVETTGITGFDDPLSLQCLNESARALQSLQAVLSSYADDKAEQNINQQIKTCIGYLLHHTDFNSFNRATFIISCANPLSTGITQLEQSLDFPITRYNRLLNQDANTLFDTGAFNVNAYSPDASSFITHPKIDLGKLLFADPIFSGNGTRSCQSCHQPGKAFTDGLVKNTILDGHDALRRNTPTLLNAALQSAQFYDLRVNTLEDQSKDVVQSTLEMHGSMAASVQKLWRDSTYRKLFTAAFPKEHRIGIDTSEVMNAIGSYVRSLVKLNSRFDEYMKGNKAAINSDELNGFNLFMGKAKCGTCHYLPLFNGTFPPRYMKTEAEVIGVPQIIGGKRIDSDEGRFDIVPVVSYRHAFKTPTVRNASVTAPYMHNGVFSTLQQVIDFYNKGGGTGLGINIDNQTLPFDKLNLSSKEQQEIAAFIKSLDSR